jgi:hypothetical protein
MQSARNIGGSPATTPMSTIANHPNGRKKWPHERDIQAQQHAPKALIDAKTYEEIIKILQKTPKELNLKGIMIDSPERVEALMLALMVYNNIKQLTLIIDNINDDDTLNLIKIITEQPFLNAVDIKFKRINEELIPAVRNSFHNTPMEVIILRTPKAPQ